MNFGDYNAGDILWLGDWSPAWIAVLAVLGLLVIGISIYDLRPLRPSRRWTLVSLRAAVYALAVVLLLEPAVDLKNVTKVKNHIAVLVDASRSMGLMVEPGATRWERAVGAVEELELPETMEDEDHVYHLLTYGSALDETGSETLKTLRPDQHGSDLAGALGAIRERYDDADLGGVIVVSDGTISGGIGDRTRRGEPLDETSEQLLRALDAPIHTVAAASSDKLRDVGISRIKRDDFAFVHNRVALEVDIQVVGIEPTSFPVKLSRDGELLQTRDLTIEEGNTLYSLNFEYVPKAIGKEIYTVELPEFPDEILLSNNRAHFLQKVIRDKIRALQVVGRPSWDERFLRRLLKRNPNVDLISFFILRTNENVQMAGNNELSLIPFPTRELFQEELGSFDIIFFQNFNFGPYDMRQYLPEISKFVREGGGFVMVGGELSFASGGYAQTPVEEVLPVQLPPRGTRNLIDETPFRPQLTEAGERHPISQLAFDPVSNRRIWEELPMQMGTNLVMEAKPQATVLATHPSLTAGGKPMPVVAVSEFGEGRTMAITTDSTWRWGFEHLSTGGTPREYQVFWNSAIRWLIKDPELKLLKVEIQEDEHTPGESMEAVIRVQKSDYTAAPDVQGKAVVTYRSFESVMSGSPQRDVIQELEFVTQSNGSALLKVPVDREGVYEIVARAQTSAGDLQDVDTALSVASVKEFRDVLPREELLEQIARASDGRAVSASEVSPDSFAFTPPRTVRVNRRTVIHVWDSVFVFGLILLLLGAEWSLRRRWGRL